MSSLPNFHDAKLINLIFDWGSKNLECLLEPVSSDGGSLRLLIQGVSNISIPAKNPWGKSGYINKLSREKLVDGSRFSIEMQSGDVLEILATSLDILS